jgi:hypothetical protein
MQSRPGDSFRAEYQQADRNLKWAVGVLAYALLCRWHPHMPGLDSVWWLNRPGQFFVSIGAVLVGADQYLKRRKAQKIILEIETARSPSGRAPP